MSYYIAMIDGDTNITVMADFKQGKPIHCFVNATGLMGHYVIPCHIKF